jgi:endonuclease YncB( thermonuclease family)
MTSRNFLPSQRWTEASARNTTLRNGVCWQGIVKFELMRMRKFSTGVSAFSTRPRRGLRLFDVLVTIAGLAALIAALAYLEGLRGPREVIAGYGDAIDVDSLRVSGVEMRLKGLDAPEYAQMCRALSGADLPCGRTSRRALADMLRSSPVTCTVEGYDRYSRRLVHCRMATRDQAASEGQDIGAVLVRTGMAVAYGDYQAEEAEARAAKRGIWATQFERPADYRKKHPRGE